jgi:hypothetical protein
MTAEEEREDLEQAAFVHILCDVELLAETRAPCVHIAA